MTDEDEDGDPMGVFDECMMDGKKGGNKYKAFTLCMICNTATCGYDQQFNQWKRHTLTARGGSMEKNKKIVVNSTSY